MPEACAQEANGLQWANRPGDVLLPRKSDGDNQAAAAEMQLLLLQGKRAEAIGCAPACN